METIGLLAVQEDHWWEQGEEAWRSQEESESGRTETGRDWCSEGWMEQVCRRARGPRRGH